MSAGKAPKKCHSHAKFIEMCQDIKAMTRDLEFCESYRGYENYPYIHDNYHDVKKCIHVSFLREDVYEPKSIAEATNKEDRDNFDLYQKMVQEISEITQVVDEILREDSDQAEITEKMMEESLKLVEAKKQELSEHNRALADTKRSISCSDDFTSYREREITSYLCKLETIRIDDSEPAQDLLSNFY